MDIAKIAIVAVDQTADGAASAKRNLLSTEEALAQIREAALQSARATGDLYDQITHLGGAVQAVTAAYAGLRLAVEPLYNAMRGGIDLADEMQKLSERTGETVDQLSRMRYAAGLTDTSMDALQTQTKKLQKNMVEAATGNAELAKTFNVLGIDIKNANIDQAVGQLADLTKALPTDKRQGFLESIQKGLSDILPYLAQGRDGIKALGDEAQKMKVLIPADVAENAAKFKDNLEALGMAGQASALNLAGKFLPSLVQITDAMKTGREEGGKYGAIFSGVDTGLAILAENGVTGAETLRGLNGFIAENTGLIKSMGQMYLGLKITEVIRAWGLASAESLTQTIAGVTASRAEAAARIAAAEATTAQLGALASHAAMQLADAEASVAAAVGMARLTAAENLLLPARERATAATAAATAAEQALAVAKRESSVAGQLATGVVGAMGGPLGMVITLLGLAATAWMVFGEKSTEGASQAASSADLAIKKLDELHNKQKYGVGDIGDAQKRIDDAQKSLDTLQEKIAKTNMVSVGGVSSEDLAQVKELNAAISTNKQLVAELTAQKKADDAASKAAQEAAMKQYEEILNQLRKTKGEQSTVYDNIRKSIVQSIAELDAEASSIGTVSKARKEYAKLLIDQQEGYTKLSVAQMTAIAYLKNEEITRSDAVEATKKHNSVISEFDKIAQEADDSTRDLTKSQKTMLDLLRDTKAWDKLSENQRKDISEKFQELEIVVKASKAVKEYNDSMKQFVSQSSSNLQSLDQQHVSLQQSIEDFGKTASQIQLATAARLEDAVAIVKTSDAYAAGQENIVKWVDALTAEAATRRQLADDLSTQELAQKQVDSWKQVEDVAHQTFISIFDSGKSVFDRLRDTLKNGLLELLYQMTVKQWVFQIGASVTGGAGGQALSNMAASAAVNGAAQGVTSGMSSFFANQGMNQVFGGGSLYTSFATSSFGQGLGLSYTSGGLGATATEAAIDGGILGGGSSSFGGLTGFGQTIGAAIPWIAGAIALASMMGLFSGDVENPQFTPYYGGSGSSIPSLTYKGLTGTYGFSQADNSQWAETTMKYIESLDKTAAALVQNDPTKLAGISSAVSGITQRSDGQPLQWAFPQLDAGSSEEVATEFGKQIIGAALDQVNSGLGDYVRQLGVHDYDKVLSVAASFSTTITVFERMGRASSELSKSLIDSIGGIDSLATKTEAYYKNYYSSTEQATDSLDAIKKTVKTAFEDMGEPVPATKDQFRQLVDSIDLTTESGQKLFTSLMNVQDSFSTLQNTYTEWETSFNSNFKSAMDTSRDTTASIREQIAAVFDPLGIKIPQTKEEFYTLVNGLDRTTESGQAMWESMMKIQQVFANLQNTYDAYTAQFQKDFYTPTEQTALTQKSLWDQVDSTFTRLGITIPASTAEFRALVEGLDRSTEAGQSTWESLMQIADAFYQVKTSAADAAATLAAGVADLRYQYMTADQKVEANYKTAEALVQKYGASISYDDWKNFTDAQVAAFVEAVTPLVTTAEQLADLKSVLSAYSAQRPEVQVQQTLSYDSTGMTSAAMSNGWYQNADGSQWMSVAAGSVSSLGTAANDAAGGLTSLVQSLRDYESSLIVGSSSALSPEEQYRAALAQYDDVRNKAMAGDSTAAGNLKTVSQALLTASKSYYGSSGGYTQDFNDVIATLDKWTGGISNTGTAFSARDAHASDYVAPISAANVIPIGPYLPNTSAPAQAADTPSLDAVVALLQQVLTAIKQGTATGAQANQQITAALDTAAAELTTIRRQNQLNAVRIA